MKRISEHWERCFLLADALAVSISVIGFGIWFFFYGGEPKVGEFISGNRVNIYRTLATISGTLLGFLITGVSLAISNTTSDKFAILRESRHSSSLWKTFLQAIKFLGLLTVTAFLCLLFDRDKSPSTWLVIPLYLFVALSIVRLLRVIWILEKIVGIVTKPSPATPRIARRRSSRND